MNSPAVHSTVMIVEGDPYLCYLMQFYARTSGYRSVVVKPDQDVLALAQREQPAVIVLGFELARAAGRDVIEELEADQATRDIPVVVCSWLDAKARGRMEKATCYLQKPVRYHDFLAALETVGARSLP